MYIVLVGSGAVVTLELPIRYGGFMGTSLNLLEHLRRSLIELLIELLKTK